jgi:hypothetical protein
MYFRMDNALLNEQKMGDGWSRLECLGHYDKGQMWMEQVQTKWWIMFLYGSKLWVQGTCIMMNEHL